MKAYLIKVVQAAKIMWIQVFITTAFVATSPYWFYMENPAGGSPVIIFGLITFLGLLNVAGVIFMPRSIINDDKEFRDKGMVSRL